MDVFNINTQREGQEKVLAFRTDNLKDITVWIANNMNRIRHKPEVLSVEIDTDLNWVFETLDGDSNELEISILVYRDDRPVEQIKVFVEPLYIHSTCPRSIQL